MSSELAKSEWTAEQIKLIKDTCAKGATDDELKLFLYRARSMGMDPLKPGQIHFIKYGTGPGTIVIGIDGFRSRATRTGKLSGIKRGVIKSDKGTLIGAWAEISRSDWSGVAREEVPLAEYNTGKGPWAKLPETMIKKVAECAALRMAFPDELGGVYEHAEMDQAAPKAGIPVSQAGLPSMALEQPTEADGVFPTDYRIPFGQYKDRSLEEVGPEALASYVSYLEKKAEKDGKPIQGMVKDFIERTESFIAAFENTPMT